MGIGKRRRQKETQLFIAADRLRNVAGHRLYERLNQLLAEERFNAWIENGRRSYYAVDGTTGRPTIPPGVYFHVRRVGRL